jgi:hypothetical protein
VTGKECRIVAHPRHERGVDGVGVVLGRMVLAKGDLAAGRLVRPSG